MGEAGLGPVSYRSSESNQWDRLSPRLLEGTKYLAVADLLFDFNALATRTGSQE